MIIRHSVSKSEPLNFDVDFKTGQVSGPDAEVILFFIEQDNGKAAFPQQVSFPAPDPLHSERDLALLLAARSYILPAEWEQYLPEIESEEGVIY